MSSNLQPTASAQHPAYKFGTNTLPGREFHIHAVMLSRSPVLKEMVQPPNSFCVSEKDKTLWVWGPSLDLNIDDFKAEVINRLGPILNSSELVSDQSTIPVFD